MMQYITWSVDPVIYKGFIELRYYSLMFVLAFVLGNYIMQRIFKAENINEKWLDKLIIYVAIGTIVGARLGHVLFYDWDDFKYDIPSIFLPFRFSPEFEFTGFQGLASHGAAIGIILALWLFSRRISKKSILWILDRTVITIALAAMLIRLGNFFNHEIIGDPTDKPWAVKFLYTTEGFEPRHPVQLYESIAYMFIFSILFYLFWKSNIKENLGKLFGLFLTLVFSARLFLEQFKVNQSDISEDALFNMGQLLSIPFILVGLYFLFIYKHKSNETV